jgi:hypothetical protein
VGSAGTFLWATWAGLTGVLIYVLDVTVDAECEFRVWEYLCMIFDICRGHVFLHTQCHLMDQSPTSGWESFTSYHYWSSKAQAQL